MPKEKAPALGATGAAAVVGTAPNEKALAAGAAVAAAADGAAPKLNVDPLAGNPNEGAAAAAGAAAGAAAPKVKAVAPAGLPNEKLILPNLFLHNLSKSKAPN